MKPELTTEQKKNCEDGRSILNSVIDDPIAPDIYEKKHYGNPYCLDEPIVLSYEDSEPAGVAAFLGMKLIADKKEIPVCQAVDVAVNEKFQGKGHFSRNIVDFGNSNKETDFIFALPNDASYPIFLKHGYTKELWLCHYIYATDPFSFVFGKHILTLILDKLYHRLLWIKKVKISRDENLSITDGMRAIPISDSEFEEINRNLRCHFKRSEEIFRWKQSYNPDLHFYWATLRRKDGSLLGYALCHLRPRLKGNFVIIDDYAISPKDTHKMQTLRLLFSSLSCLGNITEVPFANVEKDGGKLKALHFLNACKFPFSLRGGPFIVSSDCKCIDAIKKISFRNIDSDVL